MKTLKMFISLLVLMSFSLQAVDAASARQNFSFPPAVGETQNHTLAPALVCNGHAVQISDVEQQAAPAAQSSVRWKKFVVVSSLIAWLLNLFTLSIFAGEKTKQPPRLLRFRKRKVNMLFKRILPRQQVPKANNEPSCSQVIARENCMVYVKDDDTPKGWRRSICVSRNTLNMWIEEELFHRQSKSRRRRKRSIRLDLPSCF